MAHQDKDCVSEKITTTVQSEACTNVEDEDACYVGGWRLMVIIISLCLGTLLVAIDNTIIAVAIPEITSVFDSLGDVAWYGSAYLLSVTALQPTFGLIYRYFAVKQSYLSSVVIFEVGSLLCAVARSSRIFILGRAIAGLGAAGLFQGALGIVGYTVPRLKRPFYLGVVVSVFGIASCFGPIVGGILTSDVSWRWCFYINLPVGLPCFILITLFLKLDTTANADRRLSLRTKLIHLDLIGAFFLIASVCCVLLALQWGTTRYPWRSSQVIGLFVGFALLLSAFFLTQFKLGERATIPIRFLRNRLLLLNAAYAFLMYAMTYLFGYYLPFYFQAVQDVDASQSGIRFIAFAVPEVAAIVIVGALVTRFKHYVPYMLLSTIVTTAGTTLMSRIGLATTTVQWAAYMVLTGIGIGIGMQLPFTAVQVISSGSDTLIMNAIISFASQLGGALTLPVGQTIFVTGIKAAVAAANLDQDPKAVRLPPSDVVIRTGATNLKSLTSDERVLRLLREAYSVAVSHVMFLSIALAASTAVCVVFMDWRNMEKVMIARRNGKTTPDSAQEV